MENKRRTDAIEELACGELAAVEPVVPTAQHPLDEYLEAVKRYAGRGALGLDRYFTALVPFACVAIVEGALWIPERRPAI